MLDFLKISTRPKKKDLVEVYPKFIIKKSSDLMIRGGDFYAIWVEGRNLWSTDEQDALRLIDQEIDEFAEKFKSTTEERVYVAHMWDAESGMIDTWHKYCQKQLRDSFHPLDEKLIFSNDATAKEDYATKKLPYPLEKGSIESYDRLMSVLYSEEERRKLEWAIGSIVSGDSKRIQKFLVLYGSAGTGKSTVLNIVQQLFDGYYSVFDAKALGSSSNSFALEAFKSNPLVAIQHDGDLSRIEDNTRLNSLVSHELMTVNEKFKSTYSNRFNAFLFMGTNRPVKITDGKSGLIRRLIDVSPTGNKLSVKEYRSLVDKVKFELGAIAEHCLRVYLEDPGRYDDYIPTAMLGASNDFYNFVFDSYFLFRDQGGVSLKAAWEMYKTYCEEARVPYPLSQRVFKEELKTYFYEHHDRYTMPDGTRVRNYFKGIRRDRFGQDLEPEQKGESSIFTVPDWLELKEGLNSVFDAFCADLPAQYANAKEIPSKKWDKVTTTLSDLDTSKLHYVRVPENHIVIDFDILGADGKKSYEENLKEAAKWPRTYAETSKSGCGIHLHYIYTGDPSKLSAVYDDRVEVKVFSGLSSLRRKLTKCNELPIAQISSGLPLKGDDKMVNFDVVKSEKQLRAMIKKNLNKEYHPNTKPSIDFIAKILDDAYSSGMHYDVTDMRNAVLAFAAQSTNQAATCIKIVNKMRFKSDEPSEQKIEEDAPIAFYDVEVFPNLFLVNWKLQGEGKTVVRLINPTPEEIEDLLHYRLIGFNNRRYDNHILYGRLIGYDNEQLYKLSNRIINKSPNAFFGEAYDISYTDVYDFAAKKQSLKKWEIELGIHHKELGLPWDEPVPEEMWVKVAEYCDNDVLATEAVFNHLHGDFVAREILADLAGGKMNDTTNSLTTKIIFGKERNPQLVYTDLATGETSDPTYQRTDILTGFPGYQWIDRTNMYRGDDIGKGGWVYSEPGYHENVALLDIASLHPHSIIAMNMFGKYTKRFEDLVESRVFVKHEDYESAGKMFDGKLAKYLDDKDTADPLAYALKIAINSVYGLTSAGFANPFKDPRNENNIVALRGALFMRTLQDEVKDRGFTVAHIKTDSIKIPNATPEIIEFCMDFAKQYGYTFEHEATYEKMCLVNDAVYIAKYSDDDVNGKHKGQWTATGAQFQVPYVFKTLFSREPIVFDDLCETKEVKTALYLDMNEGLTVSPDILKEIEWREKQAKKAKMTVEEAEENYIAFQNPAFKTTTIGELRNLESKSHNYIFVGKIGRFCPIKPGCGGGLLMRDQNGKMYAASNTTGYRWLESEVVQENGHEDDIDKRYFNGLVDDAKEAIGTYVDFEAFRS